VQLQQTPVVTVPEFRDQGFSRPRVLVLLPHRHSALLFVRSLLRLLTDGNERQVANRRRFFIEFSDKGEEDDLEEEDEDKEKFSIERDGVKSRFIKDSSNSSRNDV
jgi:U3 small nucleolar RNA-associated protein 25